MGTGQVKNINRETPQKLRIAAAILMYQRKITKRDIAQRINVTPYYYSKVINGDSPLTQEFLDKFLKYARAQNLNEIIQSNSRKEIAKYHVLFKDTVSLLSAIEKGISAASVFDLIQLSGLSNEQVENLLGKSIKTFQNYQAKKLLLDATTSEKVLKLFSLYDKGIEIFGSAQDFGAWLHEPSYGLGYKIPFSIMGSITGIELILSELAKIEFGDLA